jgi:multidrug efflux pump subunit AcrA (membrane-fusion protein)
LLLWGGGLLTVAVVAAMFWPLRAATHRPDAHPPATQDQKRDADGRVESIVRLTPAKLEAAALHTTAVVRRAIQETRRVPGRIGYNPARRLELKVPVAGVVKQVLAGPGQPIRAGDRLAVLTSVEVGLARDAVIKSEADLQLAQKDSSWADDIADNLADLIKLLDTNPAIPYVESHFRERLLGDHRDKVLSAYSKYIFALRVSEDTDSLAKNGSLSQRLVQERTSAREVATAGFKAICEQSRFDALQHQRRKRADLEHVERVLAVDRQKLQLLLGPFAEIAAETQDKTICELVLRSPMAGVVEDRYVAEGAQFVASQNLFAVVNTETLWVSAQIYEREWAALSELQAREVQVETPALPGKSISARVQFTGVSMSPDTRSIPLVAEFTNTEGRLKPGMFAWITVPVGPRHEAVVVPDGAVMRQESDTYVFVEQAPATFCKVSVKLGLETPEVAEITRGLEPGQKVVDEGAFFLKSELLLSQDKSED